MFSDNYTAFGYVSATPQTQCTQSEGTEVTRYLLLLVSAWSWNTHGGGHRKPYVQTQSEVLTQATGTFCDQGASQSCPKRYGGQKASITLLRRQSHLSPPALACLRGQSEGENPSWGQPSRMWGRNCKPWRNLTQTHTEQELQTL